MKSRQYTGLDRGVLALDGILKKMAPSASDRQQRSYPAEAHPESSVNDAERKHIAGLMRVNHAGEIAAQALYRAQSLTARSEALQQAMRQSADEESDHLEWCERRLQELDDHSSYLEPVWYCGSFGIGLLAGSLGDNWNLGFLAETEHQVVRHIDSHLGQLPKHDQRSRSILEQMREDKLQHAVSAKEACAEQLPRSVKRLMQLTSSIMTTTAYRI